MANINAHLPPVIAAAFHPPTENLQHDNLIKPVIPKTEIISSYTKLRDDQERTQFSNQSRNIIQDESKQATTDEADQQSSSEQRRSFFFARRGSHFVSKSESGEKSLAVINDVKDVLSVIDAHYKYAVNPFPDPVINYTA